MGASPVVAADPDVVSCALTPRHESVRHARDFTQDTLQHWGLGELFDDVALVASELVTNALRHAVGVRRTPQTSGIGIPEQQRSEEGPGLPIRLSLVRRMPQVVCAVSDPSSNGPVARAADFVAESGRGLYLVDSFSEAWGWHPVAAGKVVWALFSATHLSTE